MNESFVEAIQSLCRASGAPAEVARRVVDAARGAPAPGKEKPMTTAAAAELLECSKRTVFRYAAQGKLHPIRRSARCIRWRRSELDALAQ